MEIDQVLGVDRATAFSDEELTALKHLGVQGIGFYLGGPYYNIDGWSVDDVKRTLDNGFHLMPIYVGQNVVRGSKTPNLTLQQGEYDGEMAMQLLDKFGLSLPYQHIVVLDVERATYDFNNEATIEYVHGWNNYLAAHDYRDGNYGCLDMFDRQIREDKVSAFIWLASWSSERIEPNYSLANINGLPNTVFTNHQRNLQYAGHANLAGINSPVDIDLFDIVNLVRNAEIAKNEPVPTPVVYPKAAEQNKLVAAKYQQLKTVMAEFDQVLKEQGLL